MPLSGGGNLEFGEGSSVMSLIYSRRLLSALSSQEMLVTLVANMLVVLILKC